MRFTWNICDANMWTKNLSRESLTSTVAWGLWFVMSLGSRQLKTSRRQLCRLCRSWTPNPARKHYGNTRWELPRSCESLPDNISCYHSRPHKYRSRAPRIGDRRFWSCGTESKVGEFSWVICWNYSMGSRFTSTKLVCLASRTVTTAWTSSISFCFSSSSKFMYHFASLVLPALFWIKMNRIWKEFVH